MASLAPPSAAWLRFIMVLVGLVLSGAEAGGPTRDHWVDIWGTMPQLVESSNLPSAPYNGSNGVFANATLRQTLMITQAARTIRVLFTNAFGGSDLPITAATIAVPAMANGTAGSGTGTAAIRPGTLRPLTFSNGEANITIPAGAAAVSDPIADLGPLEARDVLSVSVYLGSGQTTLSITGHPGSRTTSYMAPGNLVECADVLATNATTSRGAVQTVEHWYFLAAVQAWLPSDTASVVIVGDSITDGRGSTENGNDRWPDQLLGRMLASGRHGDRRQSCAANVAVINEAAGGNRVLYDGLGPNAMGRIDRDVLARPGVRYVIMYEGVNDLGTCATDEAAQLSMGTRLISAYDQIITRVHAAGIPIFGATITPFSGPGQVYSDPNREAQRLRINRWIRTSRRFDAVIDFDEAVRDPNNATQLNPAYNSGDYLHLTPAGYKVMAETVDLALFDEFKDGVGAIL